MFIPLRNFGKFGCVHDTMGESLPMGVWTDALNMRFSGIEMEKMLEPILEANFSGSITVSAPVITTYPLDESVSLGQQASFTVVATSYTAVSYQWLKNDVEVGADSATYSYTPTFTDDGSVFKCVVSSSSGTTTSTSATLDIISAVLTITSHPSDVEVTSGRDATFTTSATASTGGGVLSYQWYKNSVAVGSDSPTYVVGAELADDGHLVYVEVTDLSGTVTSNNATLSVISAVLTITSHPSDVEVTSGLDATFTTSATASTGGGAISYQWYKNAVAVGTDSATYTLTTAELDDGHIVYATATDLSGTVTSNNATLSVLAPDASFSDVVLLMDFEDVSGDAQFTPIDVPNLAGPGKQYTAGWDLASGTIGGNNTGHFTSAGEYGGGVHAAIGIRHKGGSGGNQKEPTQDYAWLCDGVTPWTIELSFNQVQEQPDDYYGVASVLVDSGGWRLNGYRQGIYLGTKSAIGDGDVSNSGFVMGMANGAGGGLEPYDGGNYNIPLTRSDINTSYWLANNWNKIMLTFDPIVGMTLFCNGNMVMQVAPSGLPYQQQTRLVVDNAPRPLWIGQGHETGVGSNVTTRFLGDMDNIRITKVVRETANYTPPTKPFPQA